MLIKKLRKKYEFLLTNAFDGTIIYKNLKVGGSLMLNKKINNRFYYYHHCGLSAFAKIG